MVTAAHHRLQVTNLLEEPTISAKNDSRALLKRFCRGDDQALEELVRHVEASLMRIAFRIVGQVADAEEVRQTVLLRLLESRERLSDVDDFSAWIHRCVVNEALTAVRRRQRAQKMVEGLPNPSLDAIDPQRSIVLSDEVQIMKAALETLEPEQRALLALRFDEDLTIRRIAAVMKKPHTTIQSQLTKAIDRLRIQLRLTNR